MHILNELDRVFLERYLLDKPSPAATAALLMLLCGFRTYEATAGWTKHLLPYPSDPEEIQIPPENAKRGQARTIPLPYSLRARFISAHRHRFTTLPGIPIIHSPLCPDRKGRPLPVRNLQNYVRNVGRDCFCRDLTPYTLRHTFATNLKNKTDLATLMQILGHKKLSSTQIYLHPTTLDMEKAILGSTPHD